MEIQKIARLVRLLMRWHGGLATAVYSAASRLVAGIAVRYADARPAVEELTEQRDHHFDHLGRGGNDAAVRADVDQLEELIAWLSGPVNVHPVEGDGAAETVSPTVAGERQDDLRTPQLAVDTADEVAVIDVLGLDGSADGVGPPDVESPDLTPVVDHDATDRAERRGAGPLHPENVVTREEWRTLSADFLVGGISATLFQGHGAEERSHFLADVEVDYGRSWRDAVRRWVTVRPWGAMHSWSPPPTVIVSKAGSAALEVVAMGRGSPGPPRAGARCVLLA